MKTKIFLVIGFLLLIAVPGVIYGAKLLPIPSKVIDVSNMDKSPNIEKVGEHMVLTPPGLEKRVFIHYVKPGTECGNGICEQGENASKCSVDCGNVSKDSTCYEFLGKGVIWKELPINYVINPTNNDNLSEEFITNAFNSGVEEWDSNTSTDLLANYTIDYNATWDSDAPDGKNEIVFGNYPDSGVIGVTVTWGYFSGPPKSRKILEFDILFNDNFTWGDASVNQSLMDFQNIATHELGHGIGLGDLYISSCIEETMYGYSNNGDIDKRSLNLGDITGLQSLYGN